MEGKTNFWNPCYTQEFYQQEHLIKCLHDPCQHRVPLAFQCPAWLPGDHGLDFGFPLLWNFSLFWEHSNDPVIIQTTTDHHWSLDISSKHSCLLVPWFFFISFDFVHSVMGFLATRSITINVSLATHCLFLHGSFIVLVSKYWKKMTSISSKLQIRNLGLKLNSFLFPYSEP